MNNLFKGRSLLITGGTGSFAKAMIDHVLTTDISEVRVFSRDEKKQDDMRRTYRDDRLKFIIGDVREAASVDLGVDGVDYVFHSAALKQVPSCEFYPMEAVRTNIVGAENVLIAATKYGVKKCVLLSTDKAVHPINAMGMSKALMEKVMVSMARRSANQATVFCATRYGNVMASRGSVIPLFINQINSVEQLTITNPNMTSFLMSLQDSVELVLHAFQNAKPGDVFVKKAPGCSIQTLAKAVEIFVGKSTGLTVIGTRHGEKSHESLLSREEMAIALDIGDYYRIPIDQRDLNYEKYFNAGQKNLADFEDYNSSNTRQLEVAEVVALLEQLPELKRFLI